MSEELPSGWMLASLEDLTGINGLMTDGDWIESKDQSPDGDVRLIQLADVGDGKFINKSARYLNSDTARRLNCTFLNRGDLLVARMPDPLGRACIFPGLVQPSVTAVDVCIWRSGGSGVDALWLMHCINSPEIRARIQLVAGGTTRLRVSGGNLKRLLVPVPPAAEQARIAGKIDGLFARSGLARDELAHIPKLIERYRQAVLEAAFRGDLTEDWRAQHRPSAPNIARRFPADGRVGELSTLPTEWVWRSMGDVCDVTGGLTKNQGRLALPTKIPYLRVANVYANELRLDNIEEIGVTAGEAERVRLKHGDLLIVEGNGSLDQVGRVALWQDEIANCGHQNHIIKARHREFILPKFVLYWLMSPEGRAAIELVASSSSGLHTLSISKVNGLPIPCCSMEEMAAIVEQVENHLQAFTAATAQFNKARQMLTRLNQSILDKAFSGELVPQDPNDEPASVLLERIKAASAAAPRSRRGRRSAVA